MNRAITKRIFRRLIVFLLAIDCVRAARVITDDVGRQVTLEDHPHRVVALVPSVADILFSLGHGADVAGVSEFTKHPPAAKLKPSIGLPLSPNIETILSLNPDLVIGIADLNNKEAIGNLERVHLSVVMVNGSSVANIYRSIQTIGSALNDPAAAEGLNERLRARVQQVERQRKNKPRLTVLLPIWPDPLIVAGKHAFVTELIAIAGGDSVTSDLAEDWTQISVEAVVKKQPWALILPSSWRMTMAQLAKQAGWGELECVRRNRVIHVDDRIELPSPVAFDALEDLAKQFDELTAAKALPLQTSR